MSEQTRWVIGQAERVAIYEHAKQSYEAAHVRLADFNEKSRGLEVVKPVATMVNFGAAVSFWAATMMSFTLPTAIPVVFGINTIALGLYYGISAIGKKHSEAKRVSGQIMSSLKEGKEPMDPQKHDGREGSLEYVFKDKSVAEAFGSMLAALRSNGSTLEATAGAVEAIEDNGAHLTKMADLAKKARIQLEGLGEDDVALEGRDASGRKKKLRV